MDAIGRPRWTPWPMTQSIVWFIGGNDRQRTGSKPGILSASMSFTLQLLAILLSSLLQFGSKTLTSTLGCLANWMASSLLIVDKFPSVDDLHSLLSKVTCSFLFSWSSCDEETSLGMMESYNNKTRMVLTISYKTIINHNGCPLNMQCQFFCKFVVYSYPMPKSQIYEDWEKYKQEKYKVALEIYTITVTDTNHYSYMESENFL